MSIISGRALLASPLGFLIGVSLGALGGGGSILAVPVLVFVAGQQPGAATTTSLLIVGTASVFGAVRHWRHGRVNLVLGLAFGIVGIAGSIAGSAVNRGLDGDVLLLAFAGLTLVAAWRIAIGGAGDERSGELSSLECNSTAGVASGGIAVSSRRRLATVVVAGTIVGFLTGLFGVGGGFVIVPALALTLRYPMPDAIGTSLVVIAVNSATALAARLGDPVDWPTTLVFTVAAILGVGAGTKIADRIEPETTQRAFATMLVVVALYTGGRSIAAIW